VRRARQPCTPRGAQARGCRGEWRQRHAHSDFVDRAATLGSIHPVNPFWRIGSGRSDSGMDESPRTRRTTEEMAGTDPAAGAEQVICKRVLPATRLLGTPGCRRFPDRLGSAPASRRIAERGHHALIEGGLVHLIFERLWVKGTHCRLDLRHRALHQRRETHWVAARNPSHIRKSHRLPASRLGALLLHPFDIQLARNSLAQVLVFRVSGDADNFVCHFVAGDMLSIRRSTGGQGAD
jgi:hypothetical protein